MGLLGTGGAAADRARDPRATRTRLVRLIVRRRGQVVSLLALCVVAVALTVTVPRLLGAATDAVIHAAGIDPVTGELSLGPEPGDERVVTLLATALVASVAGWAATYAQGRVTTRVVQDLVHDLRATCRRKLDRLPLADVDGRARGDLLARIAQDVDNVGQSLQQTLTHLVTATLTIVGVVVMMMTLSPLLTLVAVATVPLASLLTVVISRRSKPQFTEQWARTGALSAHVEEMYTGHALVKVFGQQEAASRRFHEHNDALFRAGYAAQHLAGTVQPAMAMVSNLNYVAVAVVGGLRVAAGAVSIGDVQAFVHYSRLFAQPVAQVAALLNLLQSGVASAERVFELLDAHEEREDVAGPAAAPRARGHVAFEDVNFSYTEDRPLIEHLDLDVAAGRTVAIVGASGAGKTTLVNLLMRFYEVDSGRITLDGTDITAMSRRHLRRSVGMVLQDTWLFHGTVAENIAYGLEGATRNDVVAAARACHVDRLIRTLPDGYDTVVTSDGGNLSAGERQLVTIARALVADPPVLVLDEATSSVDTRTELLVQEAMQRLRHGRTSFVIAHRLATVREADDIVVMDRGALVERGTHDVLVARGGPYADLYRHQLAAEDDRLGGLG